MRLLSIVTLAVAGALATGPAGAATPAGTGGSEAAPAGKRPVALDDLARLRELADIQASPDGRRALLKINVVEAEKDAYTSDLWLLDLGSGALTRLTNHPASETNPLFSPDGRQVAFIARRDDRAQVFGLSLQGGEAEPLFAFGGDVDEFAWFPDGKRMVFVAKDPEPEPADGKPAAKSDVLIITRKHFKSNDEGYLDDRRTHLFVADLSGGEVRRLTGDDFDDSGPAVSPDGRLVAFVSNRTADPDTNYNTDVFWVPAGGGAAVRVSKQPGPAANPRWSPDGRWLAFLEQIPPENYGAHDHVWIAQASGGRAAPAFGEPRNLTAALDIGVGEGSYEAGGAPYPIWSPDGRRLYVTLLDRARLHAYAIDSRSGKATLLVGGDRMVEYLTPTGEGSRLIFGLAGGTRTGEVHVAGPDGSGIRRLTHLNDAWFEEVRVSPPERFTYASFDGREIEGWTIKPLDFRPGRKYPTVLAIHGGPDWYYGVSYSFLFQALAAKGYLVIYTNPRGSTSYGQKFADLAGYYGSDVFKDLMYAVNVIETRGWVDPQNLFVEGYSYGGMMTNWIITQTDRFKAAVSGASVADHAASFGVDDDFVNWVTEMGGAPWDVPEKYRETSPMTYIKNVRTPTLFIHGLEDSICPVPESERMYLALRLLGVETRLALFPDENHNFDNKPSHWRERLRLTIDWFDTHRK
jgi:dipeptidyl aminopeptidase/acylaminoacyl peptidase